MTDPSLPNPSKKYRKPKPWDDGTIDHWTPVPITPEDNPTGLLETSSFATLFPQYREKYIQSIWAKVRELLSSHNLKCDLNLTEGSMTVLTTRKTFDPYIIIKARDFLKLLARSVPFEHARKVLNDDVHCDIIKVSGLTRNKEKFVKRRQRLIGPNGSTLKALELLTKCYILVQGQTVSCIGAIKPLKVLRKILEDCFKNIHPVYHIKEMMIRRELEKDENLKEENWERFLPQFKKRNEKRKKPTNNTTGVATKKKKEKPLFPAPPLPRKEDIAMASGEYFLSEEARKDKKLQAKKAAQIDKSNVKKRAREEVYDFEALGEERKNKKRRD
jgi:ribosomal RNA assembly protein